MDGFDATKCSRCQAKQPKVSLGGICQECYDQGWRTGKEMLDTINNDPNLMLESERVFDVEVCKRLLRKYYNRVCELMEQELGTDELEKALMALDTKTANIIVNELEVTT